VSTANSEDLVDRAPQHDEQSVRERGSFCAPPGEVSDWRLALLYDAAVDAGVLDSLPASAAEVARQLELDAHAVRVLLDALATWDLVGHGDDGRYVPGAEPPTRDEAAGLRFHARAIRRWSAQVDDRLRGAASPAPWRPGPAELERWQRAMATGARAGAPAAIDACLRLAPAARSVLDLGGGHGEYAAEFARRGLRAIVQDRPETIEALRAAGWLSEPGVDVFAGDFFETLPAEEFDVVFCAGVTHTFGRERNLELYRRVRQVLTPGGGLAILTFRRGHPVSALFAMQMLMVGGGADTHGEDDYRSWLAEAGYSPVHIQDMRERPNWLIFAAH
jgi:SAM-dependent methyltransferase